MRGHRGVGWIVEMNETTTRERKREEKSYVQWWKNDAIRELSSLNYTQGAVNVVDDYNFFPFPYMYGGKERKKEIWLASNVATFS